MFVATDGNVAPGLRFRLIQAGPSDAPMDVDTAKEFQTGDRIRFAFARQLTAQQPRGQMSRRESCAVSPMKRAVAAQHSVKAFAAHAADV